MNAPLALRLAGRFCVRKRGRVAYRTGLKGALNASVNRLTFVARKLLITECKVRDGKRCLGGSLVV
jgi:hypothetical protein